MVKELSDGVTETQILQKLWKKPEFFLFSLFVFTFISQLFFMSLFGLKFSQVILHTETSKLVYNLILSLFEFCTSQHSYPVPLSLSGNLFHKIGEADATLQGIDNHPCCV